MLFSTLALADDDFSWLLEDGSPAPSTDSQKSIGGFGAWLLVTPDKDWEAKWNTPAEHVPYFSSADEVRIGDDLTILPFFANPKLNDEAYFEIVCDIRVERPDGTMSLDQSNIPCANGIITVDPKTIFLSQMVVKYIGEEGDPFGKWTVYVDFTDTLRGVTVPLKASFNLIE
jgi:hypothetical protein